MECMVPFGVTVPQRLMGKMRSLIQLLRDAGCLVKLRPFYIPSTVEKVNGIIAAIRGQVRNIIGFCDGDYSLMTSKN